MRGLRRCEKLGCCSTLSKFVKGLGDAAPKDDSSIRSLYLSSSEMTDAGLKEVKGLKQLTTLTIRCERVTDAGLKELKGLKHLTSLELESCPQVTEGGREGVARNAAQMPNLSEEILTADEASEALLGKPNMTADTLSAGG